MIKQFRLATGRGDAKAQGEMEKYPDRARTERNRKREQKSEVFDLMFTVSVKKKIHNDVLIRIRIKYNLRLLICGLDTTNKIYCKSCLWRVLGTLLSTRKLLIKISISLTKGRRIFFLTMLFIKKLRFFKKSTIGINFIQIKYPHLRRLESLRNSCDWPTNFQNFWAKWG